MSETVPSTSQDAINQRFSELINFLVKSKRVGSKSRFADMIGATQAQVSQLSNRVAGRNATPEMISRTLQVFPDLNPEWMLCLSEGPMLLEGNVTSKGLLIDQEFVDLPFVKANMRATFTENMTGTLPPEIERIRVLYVQPTKLNKQGVVFEVNGDSMEPGYPAGAMVLALPVPQVDWQYLSAGVYAVSFGSSFVIKRIRDNEILTKGLLTLHSDSSEGGSMPVLVDDIRAVWKIDRIVYSPAR